MKIISYALFGDPNSFEFPFYLRGIYFNARMNKLLYPGWDTWVHTTHTIRSDYKEFFDGLMDIANVGISLGNEAPKCEAMLWRMIPLFTPKAVALPTHVICRDADAITTYREAQAVQEWVNSDLGFHGITDDPAHTIPILGGMCGFKTDVFHTTFPEYNTFAKLVAGANLKDHGSDQNLLMKKIWPKAQRNMMGHFFQGCKVDVAKVRNSVSNQIPGVDPKLWESNLTCRMIGSPGVVDFELLRFFKRFNPNPAFDEFERKFPQIMYWV